MYAGCWNFKTLKVSVAINRATCGCEAVRLDRVYEKKYNIGFIIYNIIRVFNIQFMIYNIQNGVRAFAIYNAQ